MHLNRQDNHTVYIIPNSNSDSSVSFCTFAFVLDYRSAPQFQMVAIFSFEIAFYQALLIIPTIDNDPENRSIWVLEPVTRLWESFYFIATCCSFKYLVWPLQYIKPTPIYTGSSFKWDRKWRCRLTGEWAISERNWQSRTLHWCYVNWDRFYPHNYPLFHKHVVPIGMFCFPHWEIRILCKPGIVSWKEYCLELSTTKSHACWGRRCTCP